MNENEYIFKVGYFVDHSELLLYCGTFSEFEEIRLEQDMENNSISELLAYYSESFTRARGIDAITYLRMIIKLLNEKIKSEHCQ